MNSIITSNQSGFLPGRNILDGVLVINEIVDFAKKIGKGVLHLQGGLQKGIQFGKLEFLRLHDGKVWYGCEMEGLDKRMCF